MIGSSTYLQQLIEFDDDYNVGLVLTKRENAPAEGLGTLAAYMADLSDTVCSRGQPVVFGTWTLEHLDVLEFTLPASAFQALVIWFHCRF